MASPWGMPRTTSKKSDGFPSIRIDDLWQLSHLFMVLTKVSGNLKNLRVFAMKSWFKLSNAFFQSKHLYV